MRFHTSLSLFAFIFCFSSLVFAQPDWMRSMIDRHADDLTLNQIKYDISLYDCGLDKEDEKFCNDSSRYYKTEIQAALYLEVGVAKRLALVTDFNAVSYSDIQLNLRKDDFILVMAKIGQQQFDVRKALLTLAPEVVDKQLIEFLNRYSLTAHKVFYWIPVAEFHDKHPQVEAVMISNGEVITVEFTRQ